MKRTADIFRGRIIDVPDATYTIELTGTGPSWMLLEAIDSAFIIETGARRVLYRTGERSLKA